MASIGTTTLEVKIQCLSLFALSPTHHEPIFVLRCVSIVFFPWFSLCLIICHSFHNFIKKRNCQIQEKNKDRPRYHGNLLYQNQKIRGYWHHWSETVFKHLSPLSLALLVFMTLKQRQFLPYGHLVICRGILMVTTGNRHLYKMRRGFECCCTGYNAQDRVPHRRPSKENDLAQNGNGTRTEKDWFPLRSFWNLLS